MNFHKNLQMLRKERKISQEKLAEKLNVSRQAVSKWENQEAYPEMDKIIAICKIFNCSMDELLNANMESERKNKSTFINYFEELLKYFASIIKNICHLKTY